MTDIPISIKGLNEAIKEIEAICLDRHRTGYHAGMHGSNIEWIMQGYAHILEILEVGYLCFCGKFNTDNDMCNHSPDDEEEWREENGQTETDRD